MLSMLDRKLFRDLWQIREQAFAIALVMGCGVATYVMMLSTVHSLEVTKDTYYDRYRFADVFANLTRGPESLRQRIAEIPGVARITTRIVRDVTLDVPGLSEPAIGRLISLPEREGTGELNGVHLRLGRFPDPASPDEVLASEAFTESHGFLPGEQLTAVINGRRRVLTIVGIALSPEYVFQIRGGDIFPDPRRFAVLWMARRPLEAAFDMQGAFNDVSLALLPGTRPEEVIRRLDHLLERYGGLGAYPRSEQISNHFVSDEIMQIRKMSSIIPTIFLAVAAFLLNVVLARIIQTQREQIAALKAFGYTRADVGLHYLKMTLMVVLLGVLIGGVAGTILGRLITGLYTQFYKFPILNFVFDPRVILEAGMLSIIAGMVGTLATVRLAMRLPPAEAMRPPAPARYRPTLLERAGLSRLLSPAARMVLRHLERKPLHAGLSILGLGLAIAILIMGYFISDSLNYAVDVQFRYAQREDLRVIFTDPRSGRVAHELRGLPGVLAVETFRAVAVRLRNGVRSKRMSILGLEPAGRLNRVIDESLRPIRLPSEGILLAAKLAEILDVRVGDWLEVEVLEGERPTRRVAVAGIIQEFIGMGAYMDRGALLRMLREGGATSGGFLLADPDQRDTLYRTLKDRPGVSVVTVRAASIQNFHDIFAENMNIVRTFYIILGTIIACGVVYNSAQVTLAERRRELASLRVLGFTRGEISSILLGELAVLTGIAVPFGWLLGYGLAALISTSLATEQIRIPLVIAPATFCIATLVIVLASIAAGLVVRRRLDHLDLVAVLKTQD